MEDVSLATLICPSLALNKVTFSSAVLNCFRKEADIN